MNIEGLKNYIKKEYPQFPGNFDLEVSGGKTQGKLNVVVGLCLHATFKYRLCENNKTLVLSRVL